MLPAARTRATAVRVVHRLATRRAISTKEPVSGAVVPPMTTMTSPSVTSTDGQSLPTTSAKTPTTSAKTPTTSAKTPTTSAKTPKRPANWIYPYATRKSPSVGKKWLANNADIPVFESTADLPTERAATVVIPCATEPCAQVVARQWTPVETRCGVLAVKRGMMGLWDAWGRQVPVTVLQLEDTYVLANKTQREHGYDAVVVGCRERAVRTETERLKSRTAIGFCRQAQIGKMLERVTEFAVSPGGHLPVRHKLSAAHFVPGQYVDVQAKSKDKGFQGVMKRWGFKGQPATHGTSLSHRSAGSIGMRKDPGKVWKGKKMAGHMGDENVTARSMQLLKVDRDLDLLYVHGTVPGPKESIVRVTDAYFKRFEQFDPYLNPPPFPTRTTAELQTLPVEQTFMPAKEETDPLAAKLNL